jgi:hypothetical protein
MLTKRLVTNIIEDIVNKNKEIKAFFEDNTTEDINNHLVCKFKFKKRDKDSNEKTTGPNTWVLEISPAIRKIIIKSRTIFVGFKSCRYSEYLQITRCYNCNGFGHISKDCTQNTISCGFCGQLHDSKVCDRKKVQLFCVNCDRFNKSTKSSKKLQTNHSVLSEECESFKRIKNIVNSKVNYG